MDSRFLEFFTDSANLLRDWLEWLGLRFNPFQPLDASSDTRLGDYLVEHHVLAKIWGDWHSFVFAPAGGGKTALRVRTSQLCWIGQATNHPFPISYLPPFLVWLHAHPSREEHLVALCQAGAIRLLLALGYYPHWFLDLTSLDQRAIHQALVWNLPGNINFWLDQVQASQSITPLLDTFDPTFILPNPPNTSDLLELCRTLRVIESTAPPPTPLERWNQFVDVILRALGFRSIYILIDGLDGIQDTARSPDIAAECLSTLLPLTEEWTSQRVFVKGYLPQETQPGLTKHFARLCDTAQIATIQWTPALLADVVRRRVYVASEGAFGSLDAVASPAVRDLETLLAKIVRPLPREMLVLTQRVLEEHVARVGAQGIIQPEDIDAAIAWYQQESLMFHANTLAHSL
ncbi:MAG: hypothetical protein N2559_13460 [Anaerolineae bacterium]|nr:hypothetical protein [Anaerolineae bacterium]